MRTADEISQALELSCRGLNCSEISRRTGIPRRTISDWVTGRAPKPRARPGFVASEVAERSPASYAYVLGMYLGDGYVADHGRGVFRLRFTLDAGYPGIVDATRTAVAELMPRNSVRVFPKKGERAVEVTCYSTSWPSLLPQHGPGRKHKRSIQLTGWQREITHRHPSELLRGLYHSDGSRIVARQPRHGIVYLYPRYCFANRSRDIIRILCNHLALIGVRWTEPAPDRVQVARRDSVEILDSFIGPKW
jgi:hypothetical protein